MLLRNGAVGFSLHNTAMMKPPVSTRDSSTSSRQMVASVETQIKEEIAEGQSKQIQELSTIDNVENTSKKSYLDDGFIFGLEGSGLERPKGKVASIVVEGDSLETTSYQAGIVATTFALYAALSAVCVHSIASSSAGGIDIISTAEIAACVVSSWLAADLGSGILHWSVDNYGNGRTPIMGNIIAAFQGHHSAPWTITQREFCNNVYKLCTPFGLAPILIILGTQSFDSHPLLTLFLINFSVLEILSQEFHKWSHMTPSECPWWVNDILQKFKVTINRAPHAKHHMAPYEGNYCIVSGVHNEWLDSTGFFRRLEHVIYKLNGVESNAWKLDEKLRERTLQGDYRKPV